MESTKLARSRRAFPPNWHSKAFFALHYDLHAGTDDTELGRHATHDHLRAELLKVRPDFVQCDCKGHPGYTSWPTKVGTPSPGIVADALRVHRDVTRELGIPLVMHYSGVWDIRAVELHPDWARVGPDGKTEDKANWVNNPTCNLSAYTDELMIPQMIELIDNYDIDGFWVDGENWAVQACYCDRCRTEFTRRTGIADVPTSPAEPNWDIWSAFHRDSFVAHVRKYADAVHARKPDCLICSNWMYTYAQPDPIDAPVDYLSGDFAWKWSLPAAMLEGRFMDGRRLTNTGLSWDLMAWAFTSGEEKMEGWTFKHTPALCQEAAAVISLSGAFLLYNQPQRSGHLTGWHQDIMADVARFVRARRPWCEGAGSIPQAAVLHNAAHHYSHAGDSLMTAWSNPHKPVIGALHALLENHISTDVLNEDTLCDHIGKYALVVIPEQSKLPDNLIAAVEKYVENGGCVIASGLDVCERFGKLAGIEADGDPKQDFVNVGVGGSVARGAGTAHSGRMETVTVAGPWQSVNMAGGATATHWVYNQQDSAFNEKVMPAATVTTLGQGRIAAIPGQLFAHFAATHYPRTRQLIGEIVHAVSPRLAVKVDAPARVHIVLRRQSERTIAHLINTGTGHPLSPASVVVEDVPRVGPVMLRFRRAAAPTAVYLAPSMEGLTWAFDGAELTVQVDSIGIMDSVVIE